MQRPVARVGTSGWQYDDWAGTFYPAGLARTRWFGHYATHFPTVEINATFYRLPRTAAVERWRDQTPHGFRFAVKGSRYLTHNKKLRDPEEPVVNVVTRLAPLQSVHGVWLWQLPPNLHRDVPRLERFLDALPRGATVPRHAMEFRHASWYAPEVEDALRHRGVAWVWLSDRQMPDVAPLTADFVYLRFHGLSPDPDARYRWDYTAAELAPWAERVRAAVARGADAWVYFNNDHAAHATRNAATFIGALGDAALPWPAAGGGRAS
jgi:uncharacterized protein YecE (DUF72 family)